MTQHLEVHAYGLHLTDRMTSDEITSIPETIQKLTDGGNHVHCPSLYNHPLAGNLYHAYGMLQAA